MHLPALNPHPYGCPLGVDGTPETMPEVIRAICERLADQVHPAIHVVKPSRGQQYPILSLYAEPDDAVPRVVLFPGWESNRRAAKRRLGFARQVTLLSRIHEAGVRGEAVEIVPDAAQEPYVVVLACTSEGMAGVVQDLHAFLGDRLGVTLATVRLGPQHAHVARLYATGHPAPRLVLLPAWWGGQELPEQRLGSGDCERVLKELWESTEVSAGRVG